MTMADDYSNKNLQNASLKGKDFSLANFSGSDLRGADLGGSNFAGADFSNVRTGFTLANVLMFFVIALAISLLSGYVAAKLGLVIKSMLSDEDEKVKIAGYITIGLIILFLSYAVWKGGQKTVTNLIIPIIIIALVIAAMAKITGAGTGRGMLFQVLALLITVIMIYVGTFSRVIAGNLSSILFVVVALAGGMFGKSIAGGIGPVILAVFCAVISKKALSGTRGFEDLRKVILFITEKFGTSFKNTKLVHANFSKARLHNADFSGADITSVKWDDAKKFNCKRDSEILTDKKKKKMAEKKGNDYNPVEKN